MFSSNAADEEEIPGRMERDTGKITSGIRVHKERLRQGAVPGASGGAGVYKAVGKRQRAVYPAVKEGSRLVGEDDRIAGSGNGGSALAGIGNRK